MKNRLINIAVGLSALALIFLTALFIIAIILIANPQKNTPETHLQTSVSPNGIYTLEAYRTEPGATVDFSIKVYFIERNRKVLIYNAYHECYANIIWIDNDTVCINEKTLNISAGETYDWRHTK